MAVFLVTYDLNKETKRPNIVKAVKDLGPWAKLSESSYAIDVQKTAGDIRESLRPLIDENDQIYVITLRQPYSGFGPEDVNEWLDGRLP